MTIREIIYTVLDEIKSVNTDSYILEEHVIFLMNNYRAYLIELKRQKEKLEELNDSYYLLICLDVELVDAVPGLACEEGLYLRSIQEVPSMIKGYNPKVYPYDLFTTNMAYVSKERFSYVGYNKYMQNIIYTTLGADNHLYLKSKNPQYEYLDRITLYGVFEDAEKAAELTCDCVGDGCVDPWDKDFPIAPDLAPLMIEMIVKELYQALVRPADRENNDRDDIASIMSYIARNMKSNYLKQLEG